MAADPSQIQPSYVQSKRPRRQTGVEYRTLISDIAHSPQAESNITGGERTVLLTTSDIAHSPKTESNTTSGK